MHLSLLLWLYSNAHSLAHHYCPRWQWIGKQSDLKYVQAVFFCLLRSQVWLQIAAYLSLKWSSKGVSAVLLLHNCHQQQPLQAMSADHCWDYLPTNDLLVSLSLCYRFCLSALCAFFSCLSCCNCLLTAHTCQRLVKLQLRCLALSSIVNGNVCSGCCWFQKSPLYI